MTLRRRLLLGMLGTLVLLVVLLAGVEVVALRGYVYGSAEQRAHDAIANSVASLGPVPRDAFDSSAVAALITDRLAAAGFAAVVQASDGSVLAARTAGYPFEHNGFGVPSQVSVAPGGGSTVVESEGRHLLVAGDRLNAAGSPVVIVAEDLAREDATVRNALVATVAGGLAALVLTAVVALLILRGGLRPLRTVAETADRIAAGDLAQRAALPHTKDEVGQLGQAFDRMVDRVERSLHGLQSANQRLREQEVATRRFVGDASHELRTPLTAIRGQAQVLLRGGLTEAEISESVGHVAAESARMGRLVDDLLLLSRTDSGVPHGTREVVDLGRLVHEQRERWEATFGAATLQVHGERALVFGDREQLQRLSDNLVSNAVKYGGDGIVEVTTAASDGGAVLLVRDHGPGIPVADREHVFDRFFRGDRTRARATGGTGLGLAIVRAIVQEHGGTVRIVDVEGGGAGVEVVLPSGPVGPAAAPGPAPSIAPQPDSAPPSQPSVTSDP